MPEEAQQDPTPDTLDEQQPQAPVTDTPEGQEADTDWQKRYTDLQSEYTRTTQENAQFNELLAGLQDPEVAPQILDQLGYQLDTEDETPLEDEGEYFDPTMELQERLDALEGAIGAQAQEEQQEQLQEAEFAYIDDQLAALEKEQGSQLSDEEANTLGTLALQLRTEEGYPDIKGAFERLSGFAEERRKAYLDQKRQAARAPEGIPGQEKVNLTNAQDRQAAAAKVIEAESDTEQ